MDVTFGLSQTLLARLHGLFRRYPEVCRVEIFGSRARGDASPASDIDLVAFAPGLSEKRFAQLWSDVTESSDSVFRIDLLRWEALTSESLRQKIRREGHPFYPDITLPAYERWLDQLDFSALRQLLDRRFHDPVDQRFFRHMTRDHDRHAAYYTSMYLLQDTWEATCDFIQAGTSQNPLRSYLEIWGFLQAVFIAQDALSELYRIITGNDLRRYQTDCLTVWHDIRRLRNEVVGHPVNRKKGSHEVRSFFGRGPHDLSQFRYERWDSRQKRIDHPVVNLKAHWTQFFEQDAACILRQLIRYVDTTISPSPAVVQ